MTTIDKEKISEYLSEHNIRPSYSRLKVFEYLITKKSHPTVDEIYHKLVKEIPTLSKTTVYNTLNILMDANIVRVITIEENETRYDADISDHGHFKCEKCGLIYDFNLNYEPLETNELEKFKVNEKNVYYIGICSKCLDNKN